MAVTTRLGRISLSRGGRDKAGRYDAAMVIPQIELPIAFAIGLGLGVLGFVVQEMLVRRRSRRRLDRGREASWGPGPSGRSTTITTAITAAAPSKRSQAPPPSPAPTEPASPAVEPTRGGRPQRSREARPEPRRAARGEITPIATTQISDRRKQAVADRNLRKREAALDAALEALVAFVDGPPRRVRARACAATLDRVLPKTGRSPELRRFIGDSEGEVSPTALQGAAEEVGIELAEQLKAVKGELAAAGH